MGAKPTTGSPGPGSSHGEPPPQEGVPRPGLYKVQQRGRAEPTPNPTPRRGLCAGNLGGGGWCNTASEADLQVCPVGMWEGEAVQRVLYTLAQPQESFRQDGGDSPGGLGMGPPL